MKNLESIIAYIVSSNTNKLEISQARLLGILYLIDWKSAIEQDIELTGIEWSFSNSGPHPDLRSLEKVNSFYESWLKDKKFYSSLAKAKVSVQDQKIMDFVLETSSSLPWVEFNHLIFSTYPVISERKSKSTNLVSSAKRYRSVKSLLK